MDCQFPASTTADSLGPIFNPPEDMELEEVRLQEARGKEKSSSASLVKLCAQRRSSKSTSRFLKYDEYTRDFESDSTTISSADAGGVVALRQPSPMTSAVGTSCESALPFGLSSLFNNPAATRAVASVLQASLLFRTPSTPHDIRLLIMQAAQVLRTWKRRSGDLLPGQSAALRLVGTAVNRFTPRKASSPVLRITEDPTARRPKPSSAGGVPDSSLPAADGVPVPDLSRAQIWNALEAIQVVFRRVLIFAKPVELSLDLAKFVLVPTGRYFMTAALSTGHYMALKGHFYVGTGISLAALTYTFSALGITEALIALGSTLAYVAAPFAINYLAAPIAAITGLSFVNVAAVTGVVLLGAAATSAVYIISVKAMEFMHPQIWLESQEAWAYVGRSFSSYGVHTTDADLRTSADFSASSSEVSTPPCCVHNSGEADTSLAGHCVPCNINAIET